MLLFKTPLEPGTTVLGFCDKNATLNLRRIASERWFGKMVSNWGLRMGEGRERTRSSAHREERGQVGAVGLGKAGMFCLRGALSCFALIELSSYIAQAGLKLLNSRKPPSSASQITDNRRPAPRRLGPAGELGMGGRGGDTTLITDCRPGLGQQKHREQPSGRAEGDRCLKMEKLSPDAVQQPAVSVSEN